MQPPTNLVTLTRGNFRRTLIDTLCYKSSSGWHNVDENLPAWFLPWVGVYSMSSDTLEASSDVSILPGNFMASEIQKKPWCAKKKCQKPKLFDSLMEGGSKTYPQAHLFCFILFCVSILIMQLWKIDYAAAWQFQIRKAWNWSSGH